MSNRLDGKLEIRLSMNFEDSVGFCPDLGLDMLVTTPLRPKRFPTVADCASGISEIWAKRIA